MEVHVKKYCPSKNGGISIINYFKSANSSSDKIDRPIEDQSSTVTKKETNKNASVFLFNKSIEPEI